MKVLPRLDAAQKAHDDAASKKITEELIAAVDPLIEEFLPGIKSRMLQKLDDDDHLSRRQKKELSTVMMGFALDPLRLGFHAFKHAGFRPWLRFDDESRFVETLVSALEDHKDDSAILADYAAYLAERREPEAAERVRRLMSARRASRVPAQDVVTVVAGSSGTTAKTTA